VDRRLPFAIGAIVVSAILTAIGTYSGTDSHQTRQFLVVLAVTLAVTAILFVGVVPRFDGSARAALVLGILAVVSVLVFWLGVPVPVAAAATFIALTAREREDQSRGETTAALALSALAVVLAAIAAFVG
jgi:hypothetical protein